MRADEQAGRQADKQIDHCFTVLVTVTIRSMGGLTERQAGRQTDRQIVAFLFGSYLFHRSTANLLFDLKVRSSFI